MTSNASLVGAAMLLAVLLATYGYISLSGWGSAASVTRVSNPASVNCVETLGGRLEIRKDATGAEAGFCVLYDGRVCEEWALLQRGECVQP